MHDLSPPPRRSSIVASQPKLPKKSGAPKAKGAVRAKSGCYTCRIRRKKCDEQPDDEGRCQTCLRLRLQCLGFGQKRPEWLKENNNVTVFREKIKDFLAAQGMIKGHSGAGARAAEQEATLVLVQEPGRSDSSSPPTPTLSASSDEHRYSGIATSNVRDGGSHYPTLAMPPQPSYSSAPHYMQDLSPDSPLDVRGGPIPPASDLMFPYSTSTPSTIMTPSSNLVSMPQTSWSNNQSSYPDVPSYPSTSYAPHPHAAQAFTSSLSQSYQQQYTFDDADDVADAELVDPEFYIPGTVVTGILPSIPASRSGLVRHYLDHVLMRQYLLADKSISEFIVRTIQSSPTACDAVCLLAALHRQSLSQGQSMDATLNLTHDTDATYSRICAALVQRRTYTEEEALTGLLVVSAFLFRGGRGAWQQFLTVASDWVDATLQRYADTADFLLRCTESQRFIIKTTFWFDILAATTRMQPPRFLVFYRRLWARPTAYIDEPFPAHAHLSMLTVMGCENATALALAEIAALACWKEGAARAGTLSVPRLVDRGRTIEAQYLTHDSPVQPLAPFDLPHPYGAQEDEIAARRRLTSNIFRAAARVYLHNVLSGDFPECPEIKDAVAETIQCLKRVPAAKSSLSSSVLRSVVFGICLCGCLTDDWDERNFILQRLEDEQRESAVGNSAEARRVMQCVWERRRTTGGPVSWRHIVQELGGESLLLV